MAAHVVLDTPPQTGSAFPAGVDPVRFVDEAATTTLRAGMTRS